MQDECGALFPLLSRGCIECGGMGGRSIARTTGWVYLRFSVGFFGDSRWLETGCKRGFKPLPRHRPRISPWGTLPPVSILVHKPCVIFLKMRDRVNRCRALIYGCHFLTKFLKNPMAVFQTPPCAPSECSLLGREKSGIIEGDPHA